jgi:hypothetical protein
MTASQRFEVWYRATDFAPEIDGSNLLKFSADDLAHALFSTGRAPGDRARHGYASVWEWLHRTSLIPAYIRREAGSRLVRSALALELDRSEKVAVSYALGQAMTGIFSEKVLSVAFLMHIDRYANRHGIVFDTTRKRADLFGRRSAEWVVAEAKGRSGSMPPDLRQKLTAQKRSIRTIEGQRPAVAYGCVASFPSNQYGNDYMHVDAFDPVEDEVEAIDLSVNLDRFILAYYEPYLSAIDFGERDDDSRFVAARYPQFGIRVGLLRPIAQRVREASAGKVAGLSGSVMDVLNDSEGRDLDQFLDGTLVETEWETSLTLSDFETYER